MILVSRLRNIITLINIQCVKQQVSSLPLFRLLLLLVSSFISNASPPTTLPPQENQGQGMTAVLSCKSKIEFSCTINAFNIYTINSQGFNCSQQSLSFTNSCVQFPATCTNISEITLPI